MRGFFEVAVLLMMLSVVSGCGFEPVHGKVQRDARSNQMESISIQTDGSHVGQILKAEIQDQVNPAGIRSEKPFVMNITITEAELSLFINLDGTSSRGDMQYNSHYTLIRVKDGVVVDSGNVSRISSYNISENADYATFVSREDARKRGILEMAQDYKLRIANLVDKLNKPIVPHSATAPEAKEPVAEMIRIPNTYEARPTGF